MADRVIENTSQEVPEIPEALEGVLLAALDEAMAKMNQGEEVVPFTMLLVKDGRFIEEHPGNEPEECFAMARHTVQGARGASAYALCYDGYVEIDDGVEDALIAEGGIPGADKGFAVGYLYTVAEDGTPTFETEPVYIGEAPNFMIFLTDEPDAADEPESEADAAEAEAESEEVAE